MTVVSQTPVLTKIQDGTSTVVAAGGSLEFYEPIDGYEGKHRYDPSAEWIEKEEKTLIRKVIPLQNPNSKMLQTKPPLFYSSTTESALGLV